MRKLLHQTYTCGQWNQQGMEKFTIIRQWEGRQSSLLPPPSWSKVFFLLGDPTSYSKYICAYILICVGERSILTRPRAVAFLPPTLDHIKEDIATLRDETTYPLRSFRYRTSTTIKCTVTQTKETINSPVRFDVQTECSVHLQLTD